MSGGGGNVPGTNNIGAAGRIARSNAYDHLYGPGWQEATLKTLQQELKERGIDPKIGDEDYEVVPKPRLVGDRFALGMICFVAIFLGLMACWAWWEYLPDAASPFYTQRTR